jgi:hypothetical protein
MVKRGIPTEYRGVQMRSRAEARWAALFDEWGWRWLYEPIDLDGYIPDFLVTRGKEQVLIEVKGDVTQLEELAQHRGKIDRSGWTGTVLLLGATPLNEVLGEVRVLGKWSVFYAQADISRAGNMTQWRPRIVPVEKGPWPRADMPIKEQLQEACRQCLETKFSAKRPMEYGRPVGTAKSLTLVNGKILVAGNNPRSYLCRQEIQIYINGMFDPESIDSIFYTWESIKELVPTGHVHIFRFYDKDGICACDYSLSKGYC